MINVRTRCRFLFRIVWLALSLTAAGAALAQGSDDRASSTDTSGSAYLIGPGDSLQVFVFGQPDLSVTVPVRPDGKVSTPLIEDIEAVGKTPTQLAREMEHVLSEYIRSPEVNVIVQKFVGKLGDQIRVLGQVMKPGAVPYRDRMTLLDVMLEVGGLTRFAAGNRARLVRAEGGASKEYRVRLNDLLNKGRISENKSLRPGDIVIVPEAVF